MIKNNKITQKLIVVLTSAVLGISLVGCGESAENTVTQKSTGSNTESTTTETRAAEQVLNLVLAPNVSTLDSNAYSWVQEGQLISSIQEPLMRKTLDENGNDTYIGAGAESYEVSDDGLVYTLHLRDNLWTDGQPVTAQDYAYAYVRELTAANGFTNVSNYTYIKNGAAFYEGTITEESELGIQAIDDKTLEITLEVPDLDALSKVADSYPIRRDVVENAKSQYGTNINELLYSGPFVVTEWTPDNKVVLNKNEQYRDHSRRNQGTWSCGK